ncbi:hypothetical protein [Peptoniphilus catoniae]|uniref:hypothetical protein n=1 Tax=Peptoniphilus catoniae TaxID=1660341 RepID=UPI0010FF2A2D|nr:hypothetical protein [Peptoniphilus catoniae]
MKIILDNEDIKFLEKNNFKIDYEKNYTDDEFLKILEDLYFQETSFVDINENKANRFADIADKVAEMN